MQQVSTHIYDWKRFWCPRDAVVCLPDDGFLPNPEEEFEGYLNPDIQPFEAIASKPCLILLGEPGSGKSHSLKAAFDAMEPAALAGDDRSFFFNLGLYGTDTRLVDDLFRNADLAVNSREGRRVHIYLDSLDECQLEIGQVGEILAAEFEKLPTERINLRIA